MRDKELLRRLIEDGWILTRINGSHHILEKNGQKVSIPIHGKDVKKGLLNDILKKTGLII